MFMKALKVLAALVAGFCFFAAEARGQSPSKKGEAKTGSDYNLPDVTAVKWTGDLDGMIKRRIIRVLVTYSKTNYFVDRGTQRGITYDAFRLFEDDLNKKLKSKHIRVHVVFVPVSRAGLIPALVEGRGDIAASNLTITPERLKQVDFSDASIRDVPEIVVTGPGAEPIARLEDLSGKEVYVHKTTSYYESLQKLNAEFWKEVLPKITLHPEVAIRTGGEIAFMIRKDSPQLKQALNTFLARYPEGSATRNQLLQKYLKSTKFVKDATSKEEMAKFRRTVEFFRKYGDKYDMDYLLMMPQGYQESRLDQNAKSPVGAIGVMQVMPATGKDMRVGDINQIEPNINAGVKYIRFMVDQFYENEPMDRLNKGLFAFAAYNAGPGRISQLRSLAAKRGLNPNVWFNNVELIASEKIGRETVTYVANIYKYYIAYKLVTEEMEDRQKAKEEVKKQSGGSK
jgi:membrane-bound lytic murein transglycosylase MltF